MRQSEQFFLRVWIKQDVWNTWLHKVVQQFVAPIGSKQIGHSFISLDWAWSVVLIRKKINFKACRTELSIRAFYEPHSSSTFSCVGYVLGALRDEPGRELVAIQYIAVGVRIVYWVVAQAVPLIVAGKEGIHPFALGIGKWCETRVGTTFCSNLHRGRWSRGRWGRWGSCPCCWYLFAKKSILAITDRMYSMVSSDLL